MRETVGVVVAAVIALYANWTTMGVDNERQALDRIRNSQGFLVRTGADE
jgi:hypothetical protein